MFLSSPYMEAEHGSTVHYVQSREMEMCPQSFNALAQLNAPWPQI